MFKFQVEKNGVVDEWTFKKAEIEGFAHGISPRGYNVLISIPLGGDIIPTAVNYLFEYYGEAVQEICIERCLYVDRRNGYPM